MVRLDTATGISIGNRAASRVMVGSTQVWTAEEPGPLTIGSPYAGGYIAGVIDTTASGTKIADEYFQTGERYLLIAAPKSLETTTRKWKSFSYNSDFAFYNEAQTKWNGLGATEAMYFSSLPATNYCYNLSYPSDGGSRWYLPAFDELILAYWNLKPTVDANTVKTGVYHDDVSGWWSFSDRVDLGSNPASDPDKPAFTTSSPTATAITAFVDGGSQSFTPEPYLAVSVRSWSYDTAWGVDFQNGNDQTLNALSAHRLRPFRRVPVPAEFVQ